MTRDKKTPAGRRAIVEERRAEARERDARRYELAEELGREAETEITRDAGFALHPPGTFASAGEVVAAANELLDALGHEELVRRHTKGTFLAQGLLPKDGYALDSPYMRFALDEAVVGPLSAYLGMVPVLRALDLWYSFYGGYAPTSSQLWHLDSDDASQVKVWIHLSDVGPGSGPLTVIDAATSEELVQRVDYDFREGHRVDDELVTELAGSHVTALEGPAGTVHLVDTSRCFHMGSRVEEGAAPRRIFVAQYLTPYSFRFRPDHLAKAPFRELGGSSELERLLLGAA